MTNEDVVQLLKKRQGEMSLRDFAVKVGCSAAYLSDIYRGNRNPGNKILKFLRMRKTRTVVTVYSKCW